MADAKEIRTQLERLTIAYPRFQLQTETAKLYVEMLADVPADILRLGVTECIKRCIFWPTVAEIREASFVWLQPSASQELGRVLDQMYGDGDE